MVIRLRIKRLLSSLSVLLLLASCGIGLTPPITDVLPSPQPPPDDLYLTSEDVRFYPVPQIYSGDLVSFDVTPHNMGGIDPESLIVHVYHQPSDDQTLIAETSVGYPTLDRVPRARFAWVWDTTGLVGEQELAIALDPHDTIQVGDEDPANNRVVLTIELQPAAERPPDEVVTEWETYTAEYSVLHYLTGSAVERDLSTIVDLADRAVLQAVTSFGERLSDPLDVYFIERVLGQGGYARRGLTLSYLDRRYVGYDLETVVRHEVVHVLDMDLGKGGSLALLREGLAVWIAGGHLRPEPIPERAAALIPLGFYVPLEELADEFYVQQHEAGYLESGALVAYLIERYGWDQFIEFYTSLDPAAEQESVALDAALSTTFGSGLEQVERDFVDWLELRSPDSAHQRDVRVTLRLFDTVRRYQQLYDPEAYFLTAWFIDTLEAESQGIVADAMRHPSELENVALETMLIASQEALLDGDLDAAESLLDAIGRVLTTRMFSALPERDYLEIVEMLAADGFEAQRIILGESRGIVYATASRAELAELSVRRGDGEWEMDDR